MNPPLLAPDGWVYAGKETRFVRTRIEDACTWTPVAGIPSDLRIFDVKQTPLAGAPIYAFGERGDRRIVYRAPADGSLFQEVYAFDPGVVLWRVHPSPSDRNVIYTSGPGFNRPFALARSNDEGLTFTLQDPVPDLAKDPGVTVFLGISPIDSNVLFVAVGRRDGNEEVWRSTDGGTTFRLILNLRAQDVVSGFTFGANDQEIYVAGRQLVNIEGQSPATLYHSVNGGDAWLPPIPSPSVGGPRYRCLAHAQGALIACAAGEQVKDAFLLGRSTDQGASWTPVITTANLPPLQACSVPLCKDTHNWLCQDLGICTAGVDTGLFPGSGDGGVGDAGGARGNDAGCGCTVTRAKHPPQSPLWGLFVLVGLVGRRRRTRRFLQRCVSRTRLRK